MIAFLCSNCGAELRVKAELAGSKGKCPRCKQLIEAPYDTPSSEAAAFTPPERASAPRRADKSTHPVGRLGETAEAGSIDAVDASNTDFESAAIHSEQDLAFLDPPQAADELGRMGNYRILKILGTGGMGIVFQAEDVQLKRQVALKSLKADLASQATERDRFLREASSAAALDHEHVITIYHVGEHNGVPYLAMKLLRGESLEDRLNKRGGRLPLPEVLRIGQEVAEGLAAAHASGLIHRDIKPANIWLEEGRDWVRIVDFGLARVAKDDGHLTQAGMILGTPAYMAPEQAHAEPLDCRCDLFSLGCVLYRMATGELPFKGKNSMAMLLALTSKTPPPPHVLVPSLPFAFSELVMALLEKNAAERPPSAQAVWDTLERIKKNRAARNTAAPTRKSAPGISVSSPTPPPPTPPARLGTPSAKPDLQPQEEELEEVADEVDLNVLAEIETSGTHGKARPFRVAKAKPKSAEIEVESEDDELERKVMKMAKWVVIVVFAIILFLIIRHFVLKMKSKEGSFRRDPQRSALVFASGWRTNEHFDRAERHHEKTFPSMAFACASDRVARLPACASLAHFSACLGGGQG